MTKQPRTYELLCVSVVLALGALMPACGGGGGDDGGGGGNGGASLVATFTPAATPGTISMAGSSAGANFSIQVQVTDVNDFFGAGFHVTFDPASAQFVGFSSSGSVLPGSAVDFDAVLEGPGDVKAYGWITDTNQPAGVDVVGTGTLMTLNFQATAATSNNPFAFGTSANRVVKVCPTQGQACNDLTEPPLSWSGGTLTASR